MVQSRSISAEGLLTLHLLPSILGIAAQFRVLVCTEHQSELTTMSHMSICQFRNRFYLHTLVLVHSGRLPVI
ncbi:hypothetical protein M758_9G064600 [Ceratodon purpureus]|nr:hypothetical protein M758_9G064600 [Ceratodon purpureus]